MSTLEGRGLQTSLFALLPQRQHARILSSGGADRVLPLTVQPYWAEPKAGNEGSEDSLKPGLSGGQSSSPRGTRLRGMGMPFRGCFTSSLVGLYSKRVSPSTKVGSLRRPTGSHVQHSTLPSRYPLSVLTSCSKISLSCKVHTATEILFLLRALEQEIYAENLISDNA